MTTPAKQDPTRTEDGRFAPGHSGNPAGRPRLAESLAERIRAAAVTEDEDRLEQALNWAWTKAARGDLAALSFLTDHGWGRLPAPVDVDLDPEVRISIVRE